MGYELDKLLKSYGVSTATMAAAPSTPTAPTVPVKPTGDAATPEALDAYNSKTAQYGFNKTAYDADVANYDANKAAYDIYKTEYQNRISTPRDTSTHYQTAAEKTTASPTTVQGLYQKYLGREGEPAGTASWQKSFGEQISPQEEQDFLRAATPEMQQRGMNIPTQNYALAQPLASPIYNTATAQEVPVNTGKVYNNDTSTANLPADFNWVEYINKNPDLYSVGIDTPQEAAAHWNSYGKNENRSYGQAATTTPVNTGGGVISQLAGNLANGGLFSQSVGNLANKYGVGMAKGGSVKHLVDRYGLQHFEGTNTQPPFDSTDSLLAANTQATQADAAVTEASQAPSAPADTNSQPYRMSPQIADVMQRNRAQQEQYNAMLDQSLNSPEMSKIGDSEKYLRLASAFLSPTKTGAFTENLGLAAGQMSEINKSQREAALSSLKLKLAAQKLRVEAGRDELQALKGAYPMATPGQVMTNTIQQKRLVAEGEEHQRKLAKDAADESQRQKDNAWKYSASGELDPKEVRKLDALYPKAVTAVKTFGGTSDALIKDIDSLIANPGLDKITGFFMGRGWMPHSDRDANLAKATYDKILARGQFGELAKIKASSPTGGALGPVSDTEGQKLKEAFGALDRVQNAEDVRKELATIREQILASKTNITDEFTNTYSYRANRAAPAAAPNVQSLVDYYKTKKKP